MAPFVRSQDIERYGAATDRDQRARIIDDWLKAEAQFFIRTHPRMDIDYWAVIALRPVLELERVPCLPQ